MAELGLLANLAGVVGIGLQLSVAIYDLASAFKAAGPEMEDMGREITLLCRVLEQVKSSLNEPRSRVRLSTTALQDTQDIVDRCQMILTDISKVLERLRKGGVANNVDVLGRVKWTFKRPRILMLRGSLQSCTAYLHLMLYTMDRAGRLDPKRSTNSHWEAAEEEQDRQMRHSLFLAQQSANRRLEELEEDATNDAIPDETSDTSWDPVPTSSDLASPPDTRARHKRNRSSTIIDAAVYNHSPIVTNLNVKRTSVLLNEHLFDEQLAWGSTQLMDHRQSVLYSDHLLSRWTNHDGLHEIGEEIQQTSQDDESGTIDRASYVSIDTYSGSDNRPKGLCKTCQNELFYAGSSPSKDPFIPSLLHPVSALLSTFKLQRYADCFNDLQLEDLAHLDEIALVSRGVDTEWARSKMLEVFKEVRYADKDPIEAKTAHVKNESPRTPVVQSLSGKAPLSIQGTGAERSISGPVQTGTDNTSPKTILDPTSSKTRLAPISSRMTPDPAFPQVPTSTPSGEIFKSFRVGLEDPCYKVLPAALRKYHIEADWRGYALYIVHGDLERCVGLEERPLELFRELDRAGRKPMFMLRRLATGADISSTAADTMPQIDKLVGGVL